jgi:hypothetical protein
MRNYGQIFIGVAIIVLGVTFLLGAIFDLDVGRFLCPTGLIVIGTWLLLRPLLARGSTEFRAKAIGDVRRRGDWQVVDEEIWLGVGDVKLDMTDADIPTGETRIRTFGIVNSILLTVPEDVGIAVSSSAVITEAKILGQKHSRTFSPFDFESDHFVTAKRKIRLETTYVVADITIKRAAQDIQ